MYYGRICLIIALSFAVGCHRSAKDGAQTSRQPNIIVLVADDLRWDMLGVYGNRTIQTPNIDGLARRGLVFDRAYVTTSICSVSRASILSGQYGRRHRLWGFGQGFMDSTFAQTYPMLLKDMGYYTGYIGKYGVGPIALPESSFDFWAGFPHQGTYHHKDSAGAYLHLTRKIGDQIQSFLSNTPDQKPFVLSVGFKAPHVQDGAPPKPEALFPADPVYDSLYERTDWTKPVAADSMYHDHFPRTFTKDNEARKRWQNRFSTSDKYDASLEGYYRLTHGIDVIVGDLLKELQEQNRIDNTVIIFTSDNGFYLGEYGFAGKWYGSEPSIRVPLVIYDPRPGSPRGRRTDSLALNIDIAPTVLALAGADPEPSMQGMNLTSFYSGEPESWRSSFFYEHLWPLNTGYNIPSTEGVVGPRYKYMRYFNGFDPDTLIFETFYDLQTDPDEIFNLHGINRFSGLEKALKLNMEQYRKGLK